MLFGSYLQMTPVDQTERQKNLPKNHTKFKVKHTPLEGWGGRSQARLAHTYYKDSQVRWPGRGLVQSRHHRGI